MSYPQQPGYGPPPLFRPPPPPGPRQRRVPWAVFAVVCLAAVASTVALTLYATGGFGGGEPSGGKADSAKDVPANPYREPEETPYGFVPDLCERLDWSRLSELLEFSGGDVAADYKASVSEGGMDCRIDGADTAAGEAGVNFSLSTYTKTKNAEEMYEHIDLGADEDGSEPLPDVGQGTIQVTPAAADGRTAIGYSLVDGNLNLRGMTVVLDADAADATDAVRDAITDILTLSKEA